MIKWGIYFDNWLDTEELKLFIEQLQLQNTSEIFKLKFIQDQNRRAFGYYLIQKCIQDLSGDFVTKWNSSVTGKPVYDGMSFNVSHDYKYVLIVGEIGDFLLGVDVCWIKLDIEIIEFKDYLSEREMEWITLLKNSKIGFYMIWALKEATTKGIGDGLAFGFKRLEFIINFTESSLDSLVESMQVSEKVEITAFLDNKRMDWEFTIQFLDKEHIVAIASNNRFQKNSFNILNSSQVVKDVGQGGDA